MSDETCRECGAEVARGYRGCNELFLEFGALSYGDVGYASVHNLRVDTYAMQHVEPYCHSAKSYAAHLMGLCYGVEHGGDPKLYWSIPKWLDGAIELPRPPVLADRGRMTIVDVYLGTAEQHTTLVRQWAQIVWSAYESQHEIARAWLDAAVVSIR